MSGGRPTDDPKETLVAVRLAQRQLAAVQARAKREGVGLSEALRRCLDEWAASRPPAPRVRPPTAEERQTFRELAAVFGNPSRRHRR
jgi:hypothetical protein